MAANGKVLINLATGLEDGEKVTVAFLVATAAQNAGKDVSVWLTKEAARLALQGVPANVACDGCPPVATLLEQFADQLARGQLHRLAEVNHLAVQAVARRAPAVLLD